MPCVAQGAFLSVQAGMICDSWQLDFYGCTAMACKPWSESAQGISLSTMRWRTSWLKRARQPGLAMHSARASLVYLSNSQLSFIMPI